MSEEIKKSLDTLKKYWGYDSFRLNQETIISSVLSGNDTLALLPTGGGKSICYQIPALVKTGICIVVSPLIALMLDQVAALQEKGIKAKVIYSGMSNSEIELIFNNCLYGKVKILYVSPERLSSQIFLSHFEKMNVNLIAIDEAHCISQWGYDFRPSFLKISEIRKYHPNVPVLALTATATEKVVEDIQEKLLFREQNCISSSFERQNISYMIFNENDKIGRIKRISDKVGGTGLVYVRSRQKAVELAQTLSSIGINAGAYHAGIPKEMRNSRQKLWMEGKIDVMIATTAFGMGIDKSDVRYVIHYDLPESIEAYYQEVGRSGRDGKESYGVLLYNERDKSNLLDKVNKTYPERDYIKSVYNAIGNYYNVPVGMGQGRRFDWDIISFSKNYNLEPYSVQSSIRVLESIGLIEIAEDRNPVSKLKIISDKDELYYFTKEYSIYFDIIESIRRLYSGVMTDFVSIDEKKIAKYCNDTEVNVFKTLQKLEKYYILEYNPKSKNPQLIFLEPRLNSERFTLSESDYYSIKKNSKEKAEDMVAFIESKQCRQQYLLEYFGQDSKPCGKCDICRTSDQKKDYSNLQDLILLDLRVSSKPMDYFINNPLYGSKEIVIPILREMMDEEIIVLEDGFLKLK